MGDDAQERSLNVHSTPRTEEMREFMAELTARLEAIEAERAREGRIRELLTAAGDPRFPPLTPKPRRPKRDRHGLHIVRGLGLAAGMAAAGLRHHRAASRILASAALVTLGTAGALTPDMMQPAPASQVPAVRPHPVAHHHHRPGDVTAPSGLPARRKRRRLDHDETATPRASVAPSPTVSPDPSPTVTPDPEPSVTMPPPVPTPDPTCTVLHGKHCHPGDEVVVADRALRGLLASL